MKHIKRNRNGQLTLKGGVYKIDICLEVKENLTRDEQVEELVKATGLDKSDIINSIIEQYGNALIVLVDGEGPYFSLEEAEEVDKLMN